MKHKIKDDICRSVSAKTGYSKTVVERVLNNVLDCVSEALSEGIGVKFAGFGVFDIVKREERVSNLNGGVIPERAYPRFRACDSLKRKVGKLEVFKDGSN